MKQKRSKIIGAHVSGLWAPSLEAGHWQLGTSDYGDRGLPLMGGLKLMA